MFLHRLTLLVIQLYLGRIRTVALHCRSVQVSNLYLLAVTRANVNAASTLVFLHRLTDVFKHYFTTLEEESLRDNFVIVYELLDEVRLGAGACAHVLKERCQALR